jgi:LCP family protein required for cell wall assembly
VGGDAGPGRSGLRTDTMIVVGIQSGTGKAVAFGVPRNLTGVPLPGAAGERYGVYDDNILNALYQWARANPSYFPGGRDPGATGLKQSLSLLLGLQIRYYALVDLPGFVDLVDAVGGVDIVATERIDDVVSPPHEGEPWIPIDVEPGRRYHLDGREALAYARSRHSTSDYNRMQRQRCILSAMAQQLDVATVLRTFPKLASVIKRAVATDIPLRRLPDVVRLIASIDPGKSTAVSFGPPGFVDGVSAPSGGFLPDATLIRSTVADMVLKPASALRDRAGVDTLRLACG